MMMTSPIVPKLIRIRITCRVTYVDANGENKCIFCDDEESNEYQISNVDIRNMSIFRNNYFDIKEPSMLVREIVKINPLRSKSKELIQLGSVYSQTRTLIDYTLSDIRITIEDGENTNNFKEAYPNSDEFIILKNLQC